METRLNGTDHLRDSPVVNVKVNQGFGDDKVTNLAGFYVPKSTETTCSSRTTSISSSAPPTEIIGELKVSESEETQAVPHCTAETTITETQVLTESLDNCQLDEDWSTVPVKARRQDDREMEIPDDVLTSECALDDVVDEDYEISDNDEDWITPSNISEHKTQQLSNIRVACATTDFAMQNVLLQIGLNVISVDGVLIKYAKTYVLKCTACFTIVRDCTRVFCTRCGNKTLEKVAVTVDEAGVTWYQRVSRKPRTGRGVRYSLPQPKGGRGSDMPWITEDQPDKQRQSKLQCNIKSSVDVMSSDFVKSGSPFGVTNVDSRAFRHYQSGGRHGNPNERKRKTGNRKKKKI